MELITNRKLIKFLKENNAYEKFIYNLFENLKDAKAKGASGFHFRKKIKVLNDTENYDQIENAFTWSTTPEGRIFWENLHIKYNIYLNHLPYYDS